MCFSISKLPSQSVGNCLLENKVTLIGIVVGGILLALGPTLYFTAGIGVITMSSLFVGGGVIAIFTLTLKFFSAEPSHEDTARLKKGNEPTKPVNTSQNLSPEMRQFYEAVENNNLKKVKEQLANNPLLAEKETTCDLSHAILCVRTLEMLQLFIDAKIELNEFAFPLFKKFINEKENPKTKDILLLLVEHIDVNRADETEKTLLHYVLENGMIDFIEPLIEGGVDPMSKVFGLTPLHLAAEYGHVEAVEKLIELGAEINAVSDAQRNTALHVAIQHKKIDVVKRLIELGADVEILDSRGRHPLYLAMHYVDIAIIKILVEADKSVLNDLNDWRTNEFYLNILKKSPQSLAELVEFGIDLSKVKDKFNITLLHKATAGNYLEAVKYLDEQYPDLIDAGTNYKGENANPFHYAVKSDAAEKDPRVVKYLLNKYPHLLDQGDDWGRTPLRFAVYANKLEIVKLLLEKGADPRKTDKYGTTLLNGTLRCDNVEMVEVLLKSIPTLEEKKSLINQRDKFDHTFYLSANGKVGAHIYENYIKEE